MVEQLQTQDMPALKILEQPMANGLRFRYKSEGPGRGTLKGANSDEGRDTFPRVGIVNYQGSANIVAQLVTDEDSPRLHAHSLIGKQCENGICTVKCDPITMIASFPNLGIRQAKKEDVATRLEELYIDSEMRGNCGSNPQSKIDMNEEFRKRISAKARNDAESIDLSVVRLMFIAYLPDENGDFTDVLPPVISAPITNAKNNLKICRMDRNHGCAAGGTEIFLLCEKVKKGDIVVQLIEKDAQGEILWQDRGEFAGTDVHRQFAIVFRTPPYQDQTITQPVEVEIRLYRPSDEEVSCPRTFTYRPNVSDCDEIAAKRRKDNPSFEKYRVNTQAACGKKNLNPATALNINKRKIAYHRPANPQIFQKIPLQPNVLFGLGRTRKAQPTSCFMKDGVTPPETSSFQTSKVNASQDQRCFKQASASQNQTYPSNLRQGTSLQQLALQKQQASVFAQDKSCPQQPIFQQQPMALAQSTSSFQQPTLQQQQVMDFAQDASFFQQLTLQQQQQQAVALAHSTGYLHQSTPQVTALVQSKSVSQQATLQQQHIPTQPCTTQMSSSLPSLITDTCYGGTSARSTTLQMQQGISTQPFATPTQFPHQQPVNFNPQVVSPPGFTVQPQQNNSQQRWTSWTTQSSNQPNGLNNTVTMWGDSNGARVGVITDQDITGSSNSTAASSQEVDPDIFFANPPNNGTNAVAAEMPMLTDAGEFFAILEGSKRDQDFGMNDVETDSSPQENHISDSEETDYASVWGGCDEDASDTDCVDSPPPAIDGKHFAPSTKADSDVEPDGALAVRIETLTLGEDKEAGSKMSPFHETKAAKIEQTIEVSNGDVLPSRNEQSQLAAGGQAMQELFTQAMDDCDDTLLHEAVIYDQPEDLSALLDVVVTLDKSEEILNSQNKQQQTALQIAALTDNLAAVKILLEAGADSLVVDKNGNHSIHVACRHGSSEILKMLLTSTNLTDRRYDSTNYKGSGCFHLAAKAKCDSRPCMKLLKLHQFDVDLREESCGRTALHIAAKYNNFNFAQCLILECEANIEATTYDGYTPLHIAAACDSCETASLLLACGADREVNSLPPESEDEIAVRPIDLARSEQMEDILNGKTPFSNDKYFDGFASLDPTYCGKLCQLLNVKRTGSDWFALADCLQLSALTATLESSQNPTDFILSHYMAYNGSVNTFRSALLKIGRHDALQLFNRAVQRLANEKDVGNMKTSA